MPFEYDQATYFPVCTSFLLSPFVFTPTSLPPPSTNTTPEPVILITPQSLIALCSQRRKEYRARWVAEGSKIGTSEWVLKGGAVAGGENGVGVAEKPAEVIVEVPAVAVTEEKTKGVTKAGEEAALVEGVEGLKV